MKITIKTGITALVLLLVYSCTKESLSTPTPVSNQPEENVAQQTASHPTPITINSVYDFSSYPFPGTFYTHGALEIAGTVTMEVDGNYYGNRAHCLYTFVAPEGTFIVKEECTFSTSPARGSWQIVSGTGAYTNLKGNGSALMPGNEENWE